MRAAIHRALIAAAVASLAAPAAAQAAQPENITAPTATLSVSPTQTPPCAAGVPCTGDDLLGGRGTWTDQASLTFRYQWLWCNAAGADCQGIPFADGPDPSPPYVLGASDVGRTLRYRVYASNVEGTTVADSVATAVVKQRPRTTAPVMTERPAIGQVRSQDPWPPRASQRLKLTLGAWDDDFADYHYAVRWLRCDASGNACVAVTGSEFAPREGPAYYDLVEADAGSTVRAELAVSTENYSKTTLQVTDATPVVDPGGPPRLLAGPFLMVGDYGKQTVRAGAHPVDVGAVLTAAHGTWELADPAFYSVRWLRCDRLAQSCVAMPEVATPAAPAEQRWSYRVGTGDDGRSIRAEVVAANRLGSVIAQTPAVKVGASPAGTTSGGSSASDGKRAVRTIDIASAKLTSTLRGVTVTLRVRRAGTLTVTASQADGGKLGSARKKVAAPGKVLVTVPLSRAARKPIASGRAVRASVKASLKDADGGTATRSKKFTLKRPRR